MPVDSLWTRAKNKVLRTSGMAVFRRLVKVELEHPIVSFTFDDFPRSALYAGGAILEHRGCPASYYASAGLMGRAEGDLFLAEDLPRLLKAGHELGCHTFHHCHALYTWPGRFEASIVENRRALAEVVPGLGIRTSAYPNSDPNAGVKRVAARHAACCRGGGQTINHGMADLNSLKAFFLEQSRERPEEILEIIRENRDAHGWLIFATHDVSNNPTKYGCPPALFEQVVDATLASGARILTVAQACDLLLASQPHA